MEYSQELIDQLLEQAKDKYPKGTKFYSAYNGRGGEGICYGVGQFAAKVYEHRNIIWSLSESGSPEGWLYNNGKWAEIISYPERRQVKSEIINNYQIY